ncbi:efflux RND transporter permease subunit [Klebsiella pneumoniae]
MRLSNLVTITPTVGAPFIQQYNQFPSVSVSGSAAEGVSSSTAMAAMGEILAENLPAGIRLRLERHVVSGAADRQSGDMDRAGGGGDGVAVPRRPV